MPETSYLEYLRCARASVQNCVNACRAWTAPYNGENPTVDSFSDNHHVTSAGHTESVLSDSGKDGIVSSANEMNVNEATGRTEASGADSRAVVISSLDVTCPPSSTTDDGITKAQEFPPSLLSAANSVSTGSVADSAGVSLAGDSTNTVGQQLQPCSESAEPISSSTNQDEELSAAPAGHSSAVVSTSDDLELFFRQLSYSVSKSEPDDETVDVFAEFDEVFSQLDVSSEDLDSQKTLTPDDPVVSDFPENSQLQSESCLAAVESENSAGAAANVERTDNEQRSDDTQQVKEQEGKMLASAASTDEDGDKDEVTPCSRTRPVLLHCKYEPPYLPTIGTNASVAI